MIAVFDDRQQALPGRRRPHGRGAPNPDRAIAARERALKERASAFGADVDPALYRSGLRPSWPSIAARQYAAHLLAPRAMKRHPAERLFPGPHGPLGCENPC
jgi:hypothetical protein